VTYWAFTAAILIAGFLTGFTIGAQILPIGIALIVLAPVRRRPRVFWPILVGIAGFELGYLLFAPLYCSATAGLPGDAGETVCTSILGPEYRGTGLGYSPPTDVGRLAGLLVGAGSALAAFAWLTLSRRRDDRP
jgi:hypothetical protein